MLVCLYLHCTRRTFVRMGFFFASMRIYFENECMSSVAICIIKESVHMHFKLKYCMQIPNIYSRYILYSYIHTKVYRRALSYSKMTNIITHSRKVMLYRRPERWHQFELGVLQINYINILNKMLYMCLCAMCM